MAYALIPDGFTLKKVTKAQEEAVKAKRRHDDIVALLNNSNTPVVVGGVVAAFFGVKLAESIIADLENRLGALIADVKQGITDTVEAANPLNISLPTLGAPAPVAPTLKDLVDYIKREGILP